MAYFDDYLQVAQAVDAFGSIDKYLAFCKAVNPNFDVEGARTEYNAIMRSHQIWMDNLYGRDPHYTEEEKKALKEGWEAKMKALKEEEEAKKAWEERKKAALEAVGYDPNWVKGLTKGWYNEWGQYVPSRYVYMYYAEPGAQEGWMEEALDAVKEKYGEDVANAVKSKMTIKHDRDGLGIKYYEGDLEALLQDAITLTEEERLEQASKNPVEEYELDQGAKNLLGANYANPDKTNFYNLVAKMYSQDISDKLKEAINNGTVRDNGLGISWQAYLKDLIEGANREGAVQNDSTRTNKKTMGENWAEATGDTESYGEKYKEATNTQGEAGETYVQQDDNAAPTRGAFWGSDGDYSGATNAAANQAAMAEEAQSAQVQAKQNYLSNASAGINRSRAGMLSDADADSTSGVASVYAANKGLGASTQADYLKKMAAANAAQQQAENLRRGSGYNTLGAVLQGAGSGAAMGATISDENMKESPKEFDQNKLIEAVKEFKRLKKRLDELKARRSK